MPVSVNASLSAPMLQRCPVSVASRTTAGQPSAPADERRDLVEQIDDDLRRELVDGRARPEVDRMHPVLPDAHPRHLGTGGLTAEGRADLAVPRLLGHGCCRGQQSRRPRRRLGRARGRRLTGALLDAFGASLDRWVHRRCHTRPRPVEQVDQRGSVASEVRHDVQHGSSPEARTANRLVVRESVEPSQKEHLALAHDLEALGGSCHQAVSRRHTLRSSPTPAMRVIMTLPSLRNSFGLPRTRHHRVYRSRSRHRARA